MVFTLEMAWVSFHHLVPHGLGDLVGSEVVGLGDFNRAHTFVRLDPLVQIPYSHGKLARIDFCQFDSEDFNSPRQLGTRTLRLASRKTKQSQDHA